MRICEVKYNCFNSKNVGFNGIDRSVLQKNAILPFIKTVKHKNTSWMFRPGAEYCKKLYYYFSKAFKNKKKVNVYNYGCSLGYEAYSFIIGMRYIDNKNFAKFMPIIAKDYDENNVLSRYEDTYDSINMKEKEENLIIDKKETKKNIENKNEKIENNGGFPKNGQNDEIKSKPIKFK